MAMIHFPLLYYASAHPVNFVAICRKIEAHGISYSDIYNESIHRKFATTGRALFQLDALRHAGSQPYFTGT